MSKKIVAQLLFPILILSFLIIPASCKTQKNFLWKVQSKQNTIYLLGTIHVGTEDMYPLNPVIEKAFEQSNVLVAEINPNKVNRNKVLKLMNYSDNDTLENHVSKKTYALVKKRIQELNLSEPMIKKMKPWAAAFTIIFAKYAQMGLHLKYGIESHFFAKATNKKLIGLETAESQMKIFNNLSDNIQEQFLYHSITDFDEQKKILHKMINTWLKGDAKSFHAVFQKEITKVPKLIPLYKQLVDERNKKMIRKIEQLLRSKDSYFVMIGSGHLVGKKGIVQVLKSKGYSVTQI